jgi:demethylmenaquinone methyltransferase/2-methoxy-6-polyprenyl-1,4-benzoquinol methylase
LAYLDPQRGDRILEIGCGTGSSLAVLAEASGVTGKVIGLDLSAGMLTVCRGKQAEAGGTGSISLVEGDGASLPFAGRQFDAIFMSFTLELFDTPEIPIVLRECRRVLQDGGRLGVVSLSKQAGVQWPIQLYEWAHRRFPKLVDCRPIYVKQVVGRSGFRIRRSIRKSMWGLPVEVVLAHK